MPYNTDNPDSFTSPNVMESLPQTPLPQLKSIQQSHSISNDDISPSWPSRPPTPFDPFFDLMSPTRRPSNKPPLRLPREMTVETTTESLAGITASAASLSEYDPEYSYPKTVIHYTPGGSPQLEFHFSSTSDIRASRDFANSVLSDALEPIGNAVPFTLSTGRPFQLPQDDPQAVLYQRPQNSNGRIEHRNASGVASGTLTLSSPPDKTFADSDKALLSASPPAIVTPTRAVANNLLSTPDIRMHPAFRPLAHGNLKTTAVSTNALNIEVRLREAAKQHEVLLQQQRQLEQKHKIRIPLDAVPALHPSPVALRVAAQVLRNSPQGRLPIGPQAVIHSKSFWIGIGISQLGLISMTAAITKMVHDGDIYQNSGYNSTGLVFWFSISVVALIGGVIVGVAVFVGKMGYWSDTWSLLGVEDRRKARWWLRRGSKMQHQHQDTELGKLNESSSPQSLVSHKDEEGNHWINLYAMEAGVTRTSIATRETEWRELYMTPEQLRGRTTQQVPCPRRTQCASTPSRHGSRKTSKQQRRLLSTGSSIHNFRHAPSALLNSASSSQEHLRSNSPPLRILPTTSIAPKLMALGSPKSPKSSNPFLHHPQPATPLLAQVKLSGHHAQSLGGSQDTPSRSSSNKVEPPTWSPLELLVRDINSERVRNMPTSQRLPYLRDQCATSVERFEIVKMNVEKDRMSGGRSMDVRVHIGTRDDDAETESENDESEEEKRGRPRTRVVSLAMTAEVVEDTDEKPVNNQNRATESAHTDTAITPKIPPGQQVQGEGDAETPKKSAKHRSVDNLKKLLGAGKNSVSEKEKHVNLSIKQRIEKLREQSEKMTMNN